MHGNIQIALNETRMRDLQIAARDYARESAAAKVNRRTEEGGRALAPRLGLLRGFAARLSTFGRTLARAR